MNETILEELYKTLPLKERQGTGGMKFKYIPNENVIDRMNKTFKGDWSTIVTHKEIIEDQLLIEVLVTASNPDTQVQFSHTGFSSQPIARYREGVNAGKIVDIGNIYKSALAKAIVNACTRWGVGLFKETNVYNTVDDVVDTVAASPVLPPAPPVSVPSAPIVNQQPVNVIPPVVAAPVTQPNVPVVPTQRVVTSSTVLTQAVPPPPVAAPSNVAVPVAQIPVVELPKVPVPNQEMAPPVPVMPPVNIQPVLPIPPVVNAFVPPAPVVNTVPSTPGIPFATQPTDSAGISDVQCVALNGILDMQKIEYGVLAKEAFDERGISRQVPLKEELNYDDAVVIIKYGNDKFRKR
jgi:hypothetical protein